MLERMQNQNLTVSPAPAQARAVRATFCSDPSEGWGYHNVAQLAHGDTTTHMEHKVCQPELVCSNVLQGAHGPTYDYMWVPGPGTGVVLVATCDGYGR